MADITLDTLGETIKEVYAPRISDFTRLKSAALTLIPENTTNLSLDKLEARPLVKVAMGSNVGARWEAEAYPDGEDGEYVQALVRTTKQTSRFTLTNEARMRAVATEGAWEDLMTRKEKDVAQQAAEDITRQVFGAGNGVIAACDTTSNSTTVSLASSTTPAQLRFLRRGLVIDVGTAGAPASVAEKRVIVAVDRDAKEITIAGDPITTTDSHRVFINGAGGSTTWGSRELVSLQQIAGTGDLYGIKVSDYPEFVGYQARGNGGSARALTETVMDQFATDIRQNRGSEPTHFLTTPGVVRHAAAQIIGQVQYTMDDQNDLKHGIRALELGSSRVKVVADDFIWEGTGFLVSFGEEGIEMASSGGYEAFDNPVIRVNQENDVAQVRLRKYMQLVATQRNSIGYVDSLTEA